MPAATATSSSSKSSIDRAASVAGKIDGIESMRGFIEAFDDMVERNTNLSNVSFESMGSDEYLVTITD